MMSEGQFIRFQSWMKHAQQIADAHHLDRTDVLKACYLMSSGKNGDDGFRSLFEWHEYNEFISHIIAFSGIGSKE